MQFILQTLLTAVPFILPILILLIAKKVGFRYPQQRPFFRAAFVLYGAALVAFAAHAFTFGNGAAEFFRAYYGSPAEKTTLCYLGFLGQGLAVVALLFVVNWNTIELFFMKSKKASNASNEREEALASVAATGEECANVKKAEKVSEAMPAALDADSLKAENKAEKTPEEKLSEGKRAE